SLKPHHNSNKYQVWNFLYAFVQNNPETAFMSSNFYDWVLTKFGPDAQITKLCFEDILKAR
ncbi:35458_t:CDS:2, partial [Racocetra persica]